MRKLRSSNNLKLLKKKQKKIQDLVAAGYQKSRATKQYPDPSGKFLIFEFGETIYINEQTGHIVYTERTCPHGDFIQGYR